MPRRTSRRPPRPASWRGRRLLITAGPTREYIDPVRYISNASSGRMGYALATEAVKLGARVTLVSGPTALPFPAGVKVLRVMTAKQMHGAVMRHARLADAVVMAAAVADWTPATPARQKIKKAPARRFLTLRLVKTPDILASLAHSRGERAAPRLIGFALETQNLRQNALRKMKDKALDMIVANPAGVIDETNTSATVLRPGQPDVKLRGSKTAVAKRILKAAAGLLP